MSRPRKILLAVIIVLVALVAAIIVVVPRLADLDRYRPEIIARLEAQTGRPAEIRRLTLTFWPALDVRVDGFALGNPAGFPPGNLIRVQRIDAQLDAGALWHHQIVIQSLRLDEPVIRLLSDGAGHWNFENPARARVLGTAYGLDPSSFTLGVIARVNVRDGDLTSAHVGAPGEISEAALEVRGVSTELQQVDLDHLQARPSLSSASGSPLMTDVRLGSGETVPAPLAAHGTLEADWLRFGTLEATHLKSQVELYPQQVMFRNLDFDFYSGHGKGNFSLDFGGPLRRYTTDVELRAVDMTRLLEAFPGARGKMTGRMSGALSLTGETTPSTDPLAGKQGRGNLVVRDGRLPTLELNRNLLQLTNLIRGEPLREDPSSFSSLAADFEIGGGRITSRHVVLTGRVVTIDAHGSLALDGAGALNYDGTARVAASQNAFTSLLGGLLGERVAGGQLSFPFGLEGTLEHPRFVLKSPATRGGSPGLEP